MAPRSTADSARAATSGPSERAVARRTDPDTSWEAAATVHDIRRSQEAVLILFKGYGPMTDEEAWAKYAAAHAEFGGKPRQSPSGLRTRRSELVTARLLRDTGERRRGSTGRRMIVWGAV